MPLLTTHSLKLVAVIMIIDTVLRISISTCLQEKASERLDTSLDVSVPMLYVITPTFPRSTQVADLTRLAQALNNIPNVTWILVEDSTRKTEKVERLLNGTNVKSGLSFCTLSFQLPKNLKLQMAQNQMCFEAVHLLGPMKAEHRGLAWKKKPKGVSNRNM